MDNSDVLQRNADGELEVRVVNGTEKADAPANYDDVFTVNSEGKRALRVVGAGGGGGTGTVTSVNGVQPVNGDVEITGDNITATVGEEEATITQHLTTLKNDDAAKVNIAQGADNAGKVMTVGEDGNLAPADAPGSSLPDQTGNAGKCLVTDGANPIWEERLQNSNNVPNVQNLIIGKSSKVSGVAQSGAIIIAGSDTGISKTYYSGTIAIGGSVDNNGFVGSICIGKGSKITYDGTNRGSCISIGQYAIVESNESIQIGAGTNSINNSFQIKNYQMLDCSTGLIPVERLPISAILLYYDSTQAPDHSHAMPGVSLDDYGLAGYEVYSNGYVRQWGQDSTSTGATLVTLPISYTAASTISMSFFVSVTEVAAAPTGQISAIPVAANQFQVDKPSAICNWETSGYITLS